MANEEHLFLLKQGVETWNKWRTAAHRNIPDLSAADLSATDLTSRNLSRANLKGARLRRADLMRTNLYRADLREADMRDADLTNSDLRDANLSMVNLSEANLGGADLTYADLSRAELREASLISAVLTRTDLSAASLNNAELGSTRIERSLLVGTDFRGASVLQTIFADVDLSSCIGLDLVKHMGPSTLGVDSIIRSKGQIPNVFLRGVGLPDEWIDYIPSLVGEAIQFFSCFISYSSLDKAFAIRLYDALQAKGIRCWFDEKQLLPGDDISRQLERGIHLWDKFLLCASKNSLTSWWVEGEIQTSLDKERALQKERGQQVLKVIPLNLDDYIRSDQWDLGVFAKKISNRVSADFRGWDKPGFNFNEQVARVIKALRADGGARETPPPSKL